MRFLTAILLACCCSSASAASRQPNIVWIVVEDMSANFGCYGETTIDTPNVDQLARDGVIFHRAIATAPICSIFRSALITGMYQTSIGAHHHRSGRGKLKIHLPEPVRPAPVLFQHGGRHSTNVSFEEFIRSGKKLEKNTAVKIAKTDYNFEWDKAMYDKTHWSTRSDDQPFFCQVQLHGGKYRGLGVTERWPQKVEAVLGSRTPASAVELPPYLPEDPVLREDWAQYLDTCRYTDWQLGRIIERLEAAGELDHTYVFFFTDHGVSHVRNKQFLYDSGVHIPLVVIGPNIQPGTVREDVVEHIDVTAASLTLAGIDIPQWMQSQDILASDYQPREYVFSARDRADETVDHIRSVRSKRFKYIRNFLPERPYLQPNRYKDSKPILQAMRRLHSEHKLNEDQARIMAASRPPEELYDTLADPHETRNLADDPQHNDTVQSMRASLNDWIERTDDRGREPESEAMFRSDMRAYGYDPEREPKNEREETLWRNIALMQHWASEGK